MTSGTFHYIPIDDITVNREGRQRRDLEDIDVLADSIRRLGLIHPLVITRRGELVAGERRLTAVRSLGWTGVAVQYTDELEPKVLRAIELEENIKRQDISWQDQVRAVTEYHKLRASERPDWTQSDTAEAIGYTTGNLNRLLQVSDELERGNELVVAAPKLSTAVGIASRARERRDQSKIEELHNTFDGPKLPAPLPEPILTADFTEWALSADRELKFNFVHCDFPYGINADTFAQSSASAHGGYADTRETWDKLMLALDVTTQKLCSPSAHLMYWFSMRKGDQRLYEMTCKALDLMGWTINPIPLIWIKSDGAGILPDPERGPRQIYETCLLGARGDRKIVRAKSNAYHGPTVRERHMSEKPEPMLRYFFEMLVDQNTIMLDPTCGSGSSLRAAESLNASRVLGLELNGEFADIARRALRSARASRKEAPNAVS